MMQNLRPRVLNKAGTPSVIKSTEMLDAVNVVADGLDTSESNTIKKVPGNIRVFLNDPDLNPIIENLDEETVLGSCVDEQRQRVFYFTTTTQENIKRGAVYLVEQFGEDEILLTLLLKSRELDFSAEDFVAADILRVPRQEKSYSDDSGDGETFEDGGDLIFDDEVTVDDLLGNIEVVSCPVSPTEPVQISPLSDGQTFEYFYLTVQNSGNQASYNNSIQIGAGSGPGDAIEHYGISVSVPDYYSNVFELEPSQISTIPITLTIDDNDIVEGTYGFYVNVYNQGNVLVGSCQFDINVEILPVLTPQFRLTMTTFGVGLNSADDATLLCGINQGPNPAVTVGDPLNSAGVQLFLQQLDAPTNINGVYPDVRVRFNKGLVTSDSNGVPSALQQWFIINTNELNTTLEVNENQGVLSVDFPNPAVAQLDSFTPICFLDTTAPAHGNPPLQPPNLHNAEFTFTDQNNVPLQVAITHGAPAPLVTDTLTIQIGHQLGDEVPELTPANIIIEENGSAYENNILANVDDNSDLNGESKVFTFNVKNIGGSPGFYVLNFDSSNTQTTFERLSAWRSTLYKASNMADFDLMWNGTLTNEGLQELNDGGPLDFYSRVRPLEAGESEQIQIMVTNVGSPFLTQPYTVVGQDPDEQYIGEFSYLGLPGNSNTSSIFASPLTSPASPSTQAVNPGANQVFSSVNAVAENVTGDLEISYRGDFFAETQNYLSTLQTTLPAYVLGLEYSGTQGDSYFVARYNDLSRIFDPIEEADLDILDGDSVYLPNASNNQYDYIVFDIKNTTLDSNMNPANVTITTVTPQSNQNYHGAVPSSLQGPTSSGSQWHNPNTSIYPLGVGSLGYIVMWTDEIPLQNYDIGYFDPQSFKHSNFSSNSVYSNVVNSQYQYRFGGYRNAPNISISPFTYRKVLIHPIFTHPNAQQYLLSQNGTDAGPFGIGNPITNPAPLCTKISISATGGINNFGPPKDGMIMHPLSQAQYDYMQDLSQVAGGTAQSPPPPGVQEDSGSVPLSSTGSGDTGSLVSFPRSTKPSTIKLKSSESKTKQKRKYGKRRR